MKLQPYQIRVIEERDQLQKRLADLTLFRAQVDAKEAIKLRELEVQETSRFVRLNRDAQSVSNPRH